MLITILTLFPEMFSGVLGQSILKRAQTKGKVTIELVNIRDFATDRHKSVDDRPYGGGTGMIMRVDVINSAIKSVKSVKGCKGNKGKIILLDPQGKTYNQKKARELSKLDHLILVSGHYEGVDERVRRLADEEISIGDYVLTGGEIPAMAIVDSVVRLVPGVLSNKSATEEESFSQDLLEYPQYTRPVNYLGKKVPAVLVSGDHAKISRWRKEQAVRKTRKRRPDLGA